MNEHIVYQKKDKQDLLMIAYLTPSTAYRPRGCTEFEFSNFRNRNWDFVHACYQPDPFFSSPRSIIPMCEILFLFVNDDLYNRVALTTNSRDFTHLKVSPNGNILTWLQAALSARDRRGPAEEWKQIPANMEMIEGECSRNRDSSSIGWG